MFDNMDESRARSISYVVGIILCWIGIGLMIYAMGKAVLGGTMPYALLLAGVALVPLSAVISRTTRLALEHEARRRR
jgi:hypothetical protein